MKRNTKLFSTAAVALLIAVTPLSVTASSTSGTEENYIPITVPYISSKLVETPFGKVLPASALADKVRDLKPIDPPKREKVGDIYTSGYPLTDKKVKLNVVARQRKQSTLDFNTYEWVKKWREKTNVDFTYTIIPDTSIAEKTNLMFAARDLPDLFASTAISGPNGSKDGALLDITDLIQKYGTNIKNAFQYAPGAYEKALAADGKIYGLPSFLAEPNANSPARLSINKKWLDALKLKVPKTTEDFYQVLKAFKGQDLNGNGKADEIPFSFSFAKTISNIYMFFGLWDVNQYGDFLDVGKDGKPYFTATSENWKECVKYLNKLYAEGLTDVEAYTISEAQFLAKGQTNPPVYASWIYQNNNAILLENREQYVMITNLTGPTGLKTWARQDRQYSSNTSGAVTTSSKYPEIAFKLLDSFFDPEFAMQEGYGEIGSRIKPYNDMMVVVNPPEGQDPSAWRWTNCMDPFYYPPNLYTTLSVEPSLAADQANTYMTERGYYSKHYFPTINYTEKQQDDMATIRTDLNEYAKKKMVEWITKGGIDAEWTAFQAQLKKIGLDKYMAIVNEAYNSYMANSAKK